MAMIQDIISKHPGFDHIQVSNPTETDKPPITIVTENGKITSMYDPTDPINLDLRASFSTNPEITKAVQSGDPTLLDYKLGDADDITGEWAEAYAVRLTGKIHDWIDPKTEASNRPTRTAELNSLLPQPLDATKLDDVTKDETEAIKAARTEMGLTDDQLQHVGIAKSDKDVPFNESKDDAEKFIQLACDSYMPLSEILTGYSSGFYMSDLLDTLIDMDGNGDISIMELVQDPGTGNTTYGDVVMLKPVDEPTPESPVEDMEDESDPESLLTYVDEGTNEKIVDNSVYAEPDNPDNYRHDNETGATQRNYVDLSIPDLGATPDETSDDREITETFTTDVEDQSTTADDGLELDDSTNEETGITTDATDQSDETTEYDPQPVDHEDSTIDETPDTEDQIPNDGSDEEIDDLVGFIGKAKKKLADLKDRKSQVDDEIDELNDIDLEETESIIESFEKDRKSLEEQIAALRERKAKTLQDIAEARRQKAEQEERLSHLDEKKNESQHLANQIQSLSNALK